MISPASVNLRISPKKLQISNSTTVSLFVYCLKKSETLTSRNKIQILYFFSLNRISLHITQLTDCLAVLFVLQD